MKRTKLWILVSRSSGHADMTTYWTGEDVADVSKKFLKILQTTTRLWRDSHVVSIELLSLDMYVEA